MFSMEIRLNTPELALLRMTIVQYIKTRVNNCNLTDDSPPENALLLTNVGFHISRNNTKHGSYTEL